MWDEIILVWNIKLLLNDWKEIFIACSDKKWLKNFHKQFLGDLEIDGDFGDREKIDLQLEENEDGFYDKITWKQIISYVYELPKGFRSLFRFLKNIKDIKKLFSVDSILVGWWEILTEETPYSYFYWFLSTWFLLPFKKLYLSGGIQIPKKLWNKLIFNILVKKSEKIYVRDNDLLDKEISFKNKIQFFPDTSFFALLWDEKYDLDCKNYKWIYKNEIEKSDYIIVNINKKAEKFYDDIYKIVEENYRKWITIYFAWICKSPADDDIVYYHKLKKDFPWLKLLDFENFYNFLDILQKAEKVHTTRLHLFLVSYYLNLNVVPFVYQKKVEKMKKVLKIN